MQSSDDESSPLKIPRSHEVLEKTGAQATNWYVITGGPSSGKSSLLLELVNHGYSIREEAARVLIDRQMSLGKSLAQIRCDETAFQLQVLQLKIEAEDGTASDTLIFWERGMPDSITYLEQCQADSALAREASKKKRYKGIFLLNLLPVYETDYARTENAEQAQEIDEGLFLCYTQLGYEVVRVPVLPILERMNFILKRL